MFHCFIAYVIFIFYFIIIIFIYVLLHFPLSGPVLTYISLLIIPCMIVYVTNNKEPRTIPKVNCMLFLDHLDYMYGVGLFWKVTLWGLNSQNLCKSYWYWVIALWTHWKKKKSAYIFFVNRSLQMTIAGSYELDNTMWSQNEALPSQISHLIINILEN